MVDPIGSNGALGREALRAARRVVGEQAAEVAARALDAPGAPAGGQEVDFAQALEGGLAHVERDVQATDALPTELLSGRVDDFHEIAVQLKDAELSFKFAMEIRNKLIDAYREIMRMSV